MCFDPNSDQELKETLLSQCQMIEVEFAATF